MTLDDLLDRDRACGTMRGLTRDGEYDFISGSGSIPSRGEFILVRDRDTGGRPACRAMLLRVASAELVGAFSASNAKGLDYLGTQRDPDPVPQRVRDLAMRHRLVARPLGWLEVDGAEPRFLSGVRELELFGQPGFAPTDAALAILVNLGIASGNGVPLGCYALGHEARDVRVRFSIDRLTRRRTFVFARAGYGKSNLTKLLLSRLCEQHRDHAVLIVDPDGEYALDQRSETGSVIPGFLNNSRFGPRVQLFTGRNVPADLQDPRVKPLAVDPAKLTPEEFVNEFLPRDKHDLVWTTWIRALRQSSWEKLVQRLAQEEYRVSDADLRSLLDLPAGETRQSEASSLGAVRNSLVPRIRELRNLMNGRDASALLAAADALRGARDADAHVLIVDTSVTPGATARALVRLVLKRVFEASTRAFTESEQTRGVLLVLEEAQSVLGRDLDDHDIFVRWAKEGRKYGLGAMLITQQPSAVATELVSQADNFFVMHLLNEGDLKALGHANAHYSEDLLAVIRSEPVRGNCYFWSAPSQPFVVPVRVDPYESERASPAAPQRDVDGDGRPQRSARGAMAPADGIQSPVRAAHVDVPAGASEDDDYIADRVLEALVGNDRIYLYREDGNDHVLMAAVEFLASCRNNAIDQARLGSDSTEADTYGVRVKTAVILRALARRGVLARSATDRVQLESTVREVFVFDSGAVQAWADQRGREMKEPRRRAGAR